MLQSRRSGNVVKPESGGGFITQAGSCAKVTSEAVLSHSIPPPFNDVAADFQTNDPSSASSASYRVSEVNFCCPSSANTAASESVSVMVHAITRL